MQDLIDDQNIDRVKSAKNPYTFSLTAFPLPVSLPWATLLYTTLLSTSLPSASLLLPSNTSEKRLNKAYLVSVLKKWAEKAIDINLKLKIAIELYILVILF